MAQIAVLHQSLDVNKPLIQCEITQYLLRGAWDIENSNILQNLIWTSMEHPEGRVKEFFEAQYVVSKWVRDLRHGLDDEFFSDNTPYRCQLPKYLDSESLLKYLRLFISDDLDGEYTASMFGYTPLLYVASEHIPASVTCLRGFLEDGADLTVTDDLGKSPLHRVFYAGYDQYDQMHLLPLLMEKLVLLLRAGFSPNAIDRYGRTPRDWARKVGQEEVWKSALQEVGVSDGEVVDSTLAQVSNSTSGEAFFDCGSHRLYVYT